MMPQKVNCRVQNADGGREKYCVVFLLSILPSLPRHNYAFIKNKKNKPHLFSQPVSLIQYAINKAQVSVFEECDMSPLFLLFLPLTIWRVIMHKEEE